MFVKNRKTFIKIQSLELKLDHYSLFLGFIC